MFFMKLLEVIIPPSFDFVRKTEHDFLIMAHEGMRYVAGIIQTIRALQYTGCICWFH